MKFLASIIITFTLLTSACYSADILGCPNGIPKGTIWPRLSFKTMDIDEKYDWATEKMVPVDKLSANAITAKEFDEWDFRLGYGVTNTVDIAFQLKYRDVYTNKQKSALNSKLAIFDENSLSEIWISYKKRFIDLTETKYKNIEYFKLSYGLAYGFSQDDKLEELIAGISPGCDKAQLGLLMHGGFANGIDFAGHLIYEWWGDAEYYAATDTLPLSETLAKNTFNFGQAGRDMPDRLKYMAVFEYPSSEYFELKAAFTGWTGLDETQGSIYSNLYKDKSFDAYSHSFVLGLTYFPMSDLYEKRKIALQVSMPYSVKATVTPEYVTSLLAMWTF